ncbi:hypothetical protein ACI2I2_06435 [Scandinavium sp. NPDC088450]|uniref:hypothetical protein n=1 Tax=Scandinavium sp. NPDC088450 TaxID=3364514 RepID=UPI00384D22A6
MTTRDNNNYKGKKITLDSLVGEYRNGGGYPIITPAMIHESGCDIWDLCEMLSDAIGLISQQDKANINALGLLVNRDKKITTPGMSEAELELLKNIFGQEYDSKSESASFSEIKKVMNGWPLELSFERGCEAIRYWALLEFTQRKTKHKRVTDPEEEQLRLDVRDEYIRNPGKSVRDFYERLIREGWKLPHQRKIERWTKDLRILKK